jgi:hypothetical protein
MAGKKTSRFQDFENHEFTKGIQWHGICILRKREPVVTLGKTWPKKED